MATGKYIGFLDSDDYADVQMYEILHNTLEEYHADIAQIGHFIISDDKIVDKIHADKECILLRENEIVKAIIGDELINSFTWDKLYRRELFALLQVLRLVYGRLFAGVCGDFAPAAGEAAPGHQHECGGVYGDRVRSGARHFSV